MNVSIAIATYNRVDEVAKMLAGLRESTRPGVRAMNCSSSTTTART